jgi:hypothetical protein
MNTEHQNIENQQPTKALLDRYFEGQTSIEEEALLQKSALSNKLSADLEAENAMFRYFAIERDKTRFQQIDNKQVKSDNKTAVILRLITAAAACVSLLFAVRYFTDNNHFTTDKSIAWINGNQYFDITTIADETIDGLNAFQSDDGKTMERQIEAIDEIIGER